MLSGALKSLFAVAEAYPDLKANQNFLSLQEELTSTEDRIAYSRQFYNDSVLSYNNKLQTFPRNLIAGMFHFEKREFFDGEPEATGPVKVAVLTRDPPLYRDRPRSTHAADRRATSARRSSFSPSSSC